MKTSHILSILSSMEMPELTTWINKILDHNGSPFRCTFVHKSDLDGMMELFQQFIEDQEPNMDTLTSALEELVKNNDYIYYDYEGDCIATFNTVEEVLDYFDIEYFIEGFEEFTYEELFEDEDEEELLIPDSEILKVLCNLQKILNTIRHD